MIRAFRSHPSLVHYILQNEARLALDNPNLRRVLERMHAEDPSRSIVGNDGFVLRSPQAWMRAYGDELLVSEKTVTPTAAQAAGGWITRGTFPTSGRTAITSRRTTSTSVQQIRLKLSSGAR